MKQRVLKSLMLIAVLLTSNAVWAYDIAIGGIFYNLSDWDNTATVTYRDGNYNSYDGDVVIPSTVTKGDKEYRVTSIGSYAFQSCSSLTSVTIPNSVTSIDYMAFSGCSNLTTINIPEGVTSIDSYAFRDCSSLTSVTIPNSVTSIGYEAFSNCSSLTSVTIPNSVTSISDNVFYNCSSLASVTIPNSVISIGSSAFSSCSSLTSVTIPNSVTSIGSLAFDNCSSLSSVTIPNSVISIGSSAFSNCIGLTSVTIPNSVESLGEGAFRGCKGLTSINVEAGNTVFDSRDNCNAIIKKSTNALLYGCKNTIIPNSVTSIGDYAFYNCTELKSVVLPSTITSIGSSAFEGCEDDEYGHYNPNYITRTIICKATTPPTIESNTFNYNYLTLEVPFASVLKYKEVKNWTQNNNGSITYKGKIIDGLNYSPISESEVELLSNNYSGNIVIPGEITVDEKTYKVTSIGNSAFSNCTGLTSISIPEGVTSIGSSTFYNCTELKSVVLPSTITSIGSRAFEGGEYDENGHYNPNYITRTIICKATTPPTIESNTFNYNYLTLEVPFASVLKYKEVKNWTQNYDGSITYKGKIIDGLNYSPISESEVELLSNNYSGNIVIPSEITVDEKTYKVTSIGNSAFNNCTSLTSISIPEGVTSIGNYAFYNCTELKSVVLPSTITSIGFSAFEGGKYLNENGYYNRNYITRTIECKATTPPTIESSTFDCNHLTLEVPFASVLKYKEVKNWTQNNNGSITYKGKIIDGLNYSPISESEVELLSNNYSGNIVIPSEITVDEKTYKVTSIGNSAFSNCTGLTSVTMPNSVTSIGNNAFQSCSSLTSVTIPNSVTSIGSSAFSNCSSLTSISIPEGVTSIGNGTFYNCKKITSVTIPNSVTSIGNDAFSWCGSLTSVTIGNSVTTIGEYAFTECNSLTSVTIPNSVTSIGYHAFGACWSLSNIECKATTPPTCDSNSIFSNTYSALLKVPFESVVAYKSAEGWKDFTYYAGTEIDGIYYVPTSENEVAVTYKDKNFNCYETSVEIPSTITVNEKTYNVTSISDNAFRYCNELEGTLEIPSNITSIGEYAFSETKYSVCNVGSVTPPAMPSTAMPSSISLVLVPNGSRDLYKKDEVWGVYKTNIIEKGSCDIEVTISEDRNNNLDDAIWWQTEASYAYITGLKVHGTLSLEDFELIKTNMTSLLDLDISDTDITEIPAEIFKNKSTLMSIKLPNGLKTIGTSAFQGCKVLTDELVLPETLETIGNYAFEGCISIDGLLEIPASVKTIGDYAFSGCTQLDSLDMTDAVSLQSINSNAFDGCTSLENIKFSESLKSIDNYVFINCKKLNNLVFPASLESIGYYAFSYCTSLENIDFTGCESLTTINSGSFDGCARLSILNMVDCTSLTTINSNSFSTCSSLKTVNFPSSLESIGDRAFANCEQLMNISVPCDTPPVIEAGAEPFYGVDNIECILTYPTSLMRTYYSANYWGSFIKRDEKSNIDVEVDKPEDDEAGEGSDDNEHKPGHGHKLGYGGHIWFDKDWHKHNNRPSKPLHPKSIGGVKLLAETTESVTTTDVSGIKGFVEDGLSLFVQNGDSVTFLIQPEEGYVIESVSYKGEDVTDQVIDGIFITPAVSTKNIKLQVAFAKESSKIILGDVNGDGTVDVSDVMALANYVLAKNVEGFNVAVADVNEDGDIDVSDVMKLANIILNK